MFDKVLDMLLNWLSKLKMFHFQIKPSTTEADLEGGRGRGVGSVPLPFFAINCFFVITVKN